jgi:hypothetical protein
MGGMRGRRSEIARAAPARSACAVLLVALVASAAVACKSGSQDPAVSSAATPADGAAPKPVVAITPHWNPNAEHEDLPRTCNGAVSRLLAVLDPDLRAQLIATPREGLAALHDSLGTSIANTFGLWDDNPQLLVSCASANPGTAADPNAVSQLIIERAWERLQRTVPSRDE